MPRRRIRSPAEKLRSPSGSAIACSCVRSRSANRLNRRRSRRALRRLPCRDSTNRALGRQRRSPPRRSGTAGSCRAERPPDLCPDRQRELADPLARLRPHGDRADEHAAAGVGEELDEAGPLRLLEGGGPRHVPDVPLGRDGALTARVADGRDLGVGEDAAGMARYSARRSRPATLLAATRPWYLPRWVKSATPVTSPTAQTCSPADSRSSTSIPSSRRSRRGARGRDRPRSGAGPWR